MTAATTDADNDASATDGQGEAVPSEALTRDSEGRRLPPLRERLLAPMPKGDWWWGWLCPLLITLVAGVLRFHNLADPRKFVFDETYYAKDAFALLNFGYETDFVREANERILDGWLDGIFTDAAFVVHPPLGKWQIAIGEAIFGMNPFGWRFVVALLGTLSVLLIARVVRRLTRSGLLGSVAALLISLDALHFVESRAALLDLIVMFWIIATLGCLLLDRDWSRKRLLDRLGGRELVDPGSWGPRLLWRPWRLAAGICIGAACATKWNGVYVLAVFGLLTWAWEAGARRAIGVRMAHLRSVVADGVPAFVTVVGSALAVYLLSWWGWFASRAGHLRTWGEDHPASGLGVLVPDALRSLWHYHGAVLDFHENLTQEHQYMSKAIGWLVINRPVSFSFDNDIGRADGCPERECVRAILGIGTPFLWWGATIALAACLVYWLWSRDWRFAVPLLGVVATWVPWLPWGERPIFFFYASAILPFMVIALTLALGLVIGQPGASPRRRLWGGLVAGGCVLAIAVNFMQYYPIVSNQLMTAEQWGSLIWFGSWL